MEKHGRGSRVRLVAKHSNLVPPSRLMAHMGEISRRWNFSGGRYRYVRKLRALSAPVQRAQLWDLMWLMLAAALVFTTVSGNDDHDAEHEARDGNRYLAGRGPRYMSKPAVVSRTSLIFASPSTWLIGWRNWRPQRSRISRPVSGKSNQANQARGPPSKCRRRPAQRRGEGQKRPSPSSLPAEIGVG